MRISPAEPQCFHRAFGRLSTQLYLRTFLILLSPLHPGGPGEGPDCHFPKDIGGLGRFRPGSGGNIFSVFILALSAAGSMVCVGTWLALYQRGETETAVARALLCLRPFCILLLAPLLRKSLVVGRFRPGSGGVMCLLFLILALSGTPSRGGADLPHAY